MTITRRHVLALAAPATSFGQDALAQPLDAPARMGWLSYLAPPDSALDDLLAGLRELGYVSGKSFVMVSRFAEGDYTRLPRLVQELSAERLKVLVSRGPSVDYTIAIRTKVPIVFAYSGDPVAAGFADSLAKPGRNMTGITFMALELSAKRVEVLKEILPKVSTIALLSNPEHPGELAEYRVTEDAARRLGAKITRFLVRAPQELLGVLADVRLNRPDAMLVFPDSMTLARRKEIVDFAAQERIPCMYGWSEFVEAGGLASYGPRVNDHFKTLASYVDKIVKGADASTTPIEQVRQISLTLNARAARDLGLTLPRSILARADRIIE